MKELRLLSKIRYVVLVLALITCSAHVQAQNINMALKDATVERILEYLGQNYDFSFSIKTDEVDVSRRVSIDVSNASIEEVLGQLFARQDVTWTINGKTISVAPKPQPAAAAAPSRAQTIRGHVVDDKGLPLIGATIIEKGTTNGASTDVDGNFSLTLKSAAPSIIVSYVGYKDVEQRVPATRSELDITLYPNSTVMDDVVVVGYGTQRRASLTGAVSTINFSEHLESRPVMNASTALAGLSAGLQVMQTSGQPGSDGATLRIRGTGTLNTNSPLVLVDGIEWSMNDINTNDIASITVLKDAASTAIYGSRAANGVILVTTKQGSKDTRVTYSFAGIFQYPYNKLKWVSDYARHMELINEAADNIGQAHIFSDSSIQTWRQAQADPNGLNEFGVPNYMAYPNTDWFSEIFSPGFSQEHNLSVEGSSEKVKYMLSLGYLDNNGVMNRFKEIDSGTSKIDFRANIEAQVNKWLKIGTRTFGTRQDYGLANVSNAFNFIYQTTPGIYPGTPDKWGRVANAAEDSSNVNNIFSQMAGPAGHNTVYRLNASMYAIAQLYKGLTFEATGNYAPVFQDRNTYSRKNGVWDYNTNTRYSESNLANASNANSSNVSYRLNTEMLLRYHENFGEDHEFGALVGFTTNQYMARSFSVSKKGSPDWSITEMSAYTDYDSSSSSTAEWGLMSVFGRLNYAYKDRYMLEANLRYDGSSRFSPSHRWGLFPSFSAGWRIKEEPFMKDVDWLSNLKLRASWGVTGNNNSGNYAWQTIYNSVKVVTDGTNTNGLLQKEQGNDNLEWETTYMTNIGLDVGVFNNKLTAEVDYYVKKTDGILFRPSIYETMGNITGAYANIAAIRNSGVEIALNHANTVAGGDFHYNIGVNLAFNRNMVTKYKGRLERYWRENADGTRTYVNNIADVAEGGFGGRILEGHQLGEHYLYQLYKGSGKGYNGVELDVNAGPKDGMIRTEEDMAWVRAMIDAGYTFRGIEKLSKDQLWYGDFIYADLNGDGNYGDTNDMDFNGYTNTPKWNAGLNLSFSWKGLDFYALFTGSFGFHLTWTTQYYNTTKVTNGHGIAERIADDHYFYDPDNFLDPRTNINGKNPRLMLNDDQGNALASDFREYRGDYVKLKNLQIGYTLPQRITKKFLVSKWRFYVSTENLCTITGYPGLDPEIGTSIGYPLMRSLSFGTQITF